ncbi:hypothetical protein PCIT_a4317 [Pseudoalteromonas citrea]|uniref:Uncharacterized protein n=1 Tax=Pseudoalteromonas citrea TaxID=43655 RepID=A0AAD4AIQ0_9GAMM|nr:hypothetical protein PCIT_a4317 [Pseudoalteromonas citrea]
MVCFVFSGKCAVIRFILKGWVLFVRIKLNEIKVFLYSLSGLDFLACIS